MQSLCVFLTIRQSRAELQSLAHLIESMWTQHNPPVSPNSLDLDQMFSFLQEEKANDQLEANDKEEAVNQINEAFEVLNDLWEVNSNMFLLLTILASPVE